MIVEGREIDGHYWAIKETTLGALIRYADRGIPPGGFLRAVLENNLSEAFARADLENTQALGLIVSFLYNELPAPCWGSPEKVRAWLEKKAEETALA